MKIMREFKEFALRGNVIDMAVGIIMGAAFTTLVQSAVNNVIMPPIGAVIGGVDFSDLKLQIKDETKVTDLMGNQVKNADGTDKIMPAVFLSYGSFLNSIINLFIVSLAIFGLIKAINTLRSRLEGPKEAPATGPPPPTKDQELLAEIRDLLRKK